VGNASSNAHAKFRCTALRTKEAVGIFRELITGRTTATTRVAFWDLPSGCNKQQSALQQYPAVFLRHLAYVALVVVVVVCCSCSSCRSFVVVLQQQQRSAETGATWRTTPHQRSK